MYSPNVLGLCVKTGLKPFLSLIFDVRMTLNTVNMMIITIAANKRTVSMTIPASNPVLLTSALIVGDSNPSVLLVGDSKKSIVNTREQCNPTLWHTIR